jgi:tetratricopeptide (TPR) repeat protein
MYLRTPKRYTARRRVHLLNLRWLWLYLLAPLIIIPAALAWNYREPISQSIGEWTQRNIQIQINLPTLTPTVPVANLRERFIGYVQAGNIDNAISTLSSLADTAPNDVSFHALLARMIILRGDDQDQTKLDAALQAGLKAINANPEAPDGWIVTALILDKSGKYQEALPYALRARDLDSKNPLMLAVIAEIYNDLRRPDEAEKLVDEALKLARAGQPVDTLALAYGNFVRGVILLSSDGREATRAFEEAWRVAISEPGVPVGFIAQLLWSAYINTGQASRLVDILGQAIERDKDDPVNPYLLGRVYIKSGDVNKARPFIDKCLDLDPEQPKCLQWQAELFFSQQNYLKAAEKTQN